MAKYILAENQLTTYRDRKYRGNEKKRIIQLKTSTTVYVGNLSFSTTEEQILELFERAGDVRRIIMGLDYYNKTPCGFCFVEFFTREATERAVLYINRTCLDERPIRVDYDQGFTEGRQFGRGLSGGQVRDEFRSNYDRERGGLGARQRMMTKMNQLSVDGTSHESGNAPVKSEADPLTTVQDQDGAFESEQSSQTQQSKQTTE